MSENIDQDILSLDITLENEQASEKLARQIAMLVEPGDLILLQGDLGTGKTTIARAMLRAMSGNPELEVPSPTFTLVQPYALDTISVAHVDLCRIEAPSDIDELGLDEMLEAGCVIVEWPERAEGTLPAGGMKIELSDSGASRSARLIALDESWAERLNRMQEIDALLEKAGWQQAVRHQLPGDASSRRYERLSNGPGGVSGLLMDMPARPDGPPVRNGLPYSRIAHLAEDIRAVEAINQGLIDKGLSAPVIHAIDMPAGLAVIEDFGASSFGKLFKEDGEDIELCLSAAAQLLAWMAQESWPDTVMLSDGSAYQLQSYDMGALLIEAELCLDWYWPHLLGEAPADSVRDEFIELWRKALDPVAQAKSVWVLRDFHVDNLFWLPERDSHARVGLIDTQDCVLGHPAYDLASLLQDVRVTFDADQVVQLYEAYVAQRKAQDVSFDEAAFEQAYCVLGAQRATKILGIFARLNARDGKPDYLDFLPRTSDVLETNLQHPALADIKAWFNDYLPAELRNRTAS